MTTVNNFTVTGTLTENDGVYSGFSKDNYIVPNTKFSVDKAWSFTMRIKTPNGMSDYHHMFSVMEPPTMSLLLGTIGSVPALWASTNGSSWNISNNQGSGTLQNNAWQYIRVLWDYTYYSIALSNDGITFNNVYSKASATPVYNNDTYPRIGSWVDFAFGGQIDMNETYYTYDGNVIWTGRSEVQNYSGTHIQLRHDTSTNWGTVNPTLYNGEIGVITDNKKYVVGDGETKFNSLEQYSMNATTIKKLTATEYTNLSSKNPTTLYVVVADNSSDFTLYYGTIPLS